ncbi:putative LRR receptor-like serine/threonine-protein kinase [Camellia lanceoleosa]|uniref:LRR receptor-like serine/threonine-protein kinase n=1 Tax=Camellia lanceoleosa TaxID=1840588 RepID=A0ACC0HJT7_9ERIC|nr:putative LRR receptor-like serine/threonine-protein kinase [Camellia lanceoleosa]
MESNLVLSLVSNYDSFGAWKHYRKVYALDVVGVIPEELWTLTFLINLDLRQNYLTGSLFASIGNLSRMQYLTVGINALSGELAKELGKLTDLRSLAFGTNNFSGTLPLELGNLTKLEQLYFVSCGVSGAIPSTFAVLQNLQIVKNFGDLSWALDNELTGSIPEFIGNWSKLKSLRFEGNSFGGPIPTTFSNLTVMEDFISINLIFSFIIYPCSSRRISNLSNGSSSLNSGNNNIFGSIPSNIGDYQRLSTPIYFNLKFGQFRVRWGKMGSKPQKWFSFPKYEGYIISEA